MRCRKTSGKGVRHTGNNKPGREHLRNDEPLRRDMARYMVRFFAPPTFQRHKETEVISLVGLSLRQIARSPAPKAESSFERLHKPASMATKPTARTTPPLSLKRPAASSMIISVGSGVADDSSAPGSVVVSVGSPAEGSLVSVEGSVAVVGEVSDGSPLVPTVVETGTLPEALPAGAAPMVLTVYNVRRSALVSQLSTTSRSCLVSYSGAGQTCIPGHALT